MHVRGKTTSRSTPTRSGGSYEDAVGYAFYPVDDHPNDGKGVNDRLLRPSVLPSIPLLGKDMPGWGLPIALERQGLRAVHERYGRLYTPRTARGDVGSPSE